MDEEYEDGMEDRGRPFLRLYDVDQGGLYQEVGDWITDFKLDTGLDVWIEAENGRKSKL